MTESTLNPWRTIWRSPRVTIRQILDAERPPSWIPPFAIGAFVSLLDTLNSCLAPPAAPTTFIAQRLVITAVGMALAMWLGAEFLSAYGRWRGGVGVAKEIRFAYGWSEVPLAAAGVIWIPLWIVNGGAYETAPTAGAPIRWAPDLIYFAMTILFVWSGVIFVATLAEVHRFSIGRAVETTIVMTVIFVVGYFAFMRAFGLETGRPRIDAASPAATAIDMRRP